MKTNWDHIRGYKQREFMPTTKPDYLNAGDPPTMSEGWDMHGVLMHKMDEIRDAAQGTTTRRVRVTIHVDGGFVWEGHSEGSLHKGSVADLQAGQPKLGRASDFTIWEYINDKGWVPWPLMKQALLVYRLCGKEFGIGLYPFWKEQGIHLDYRAGVFDRTPAVWYRDKEGKYFHYSPELFYEMLEDVCGVLRENPTDWLDLGIEPGQRAGEDT